MTRRLLTTLAICLLWCELPAQTTYYVNNMTGSDASTGTSPGTPKRTIQAAIASATSRDSISVDATGQVYEENVRVSGKTLTLTSRSGIPDVALITVDQPLQSYELHFIRSFRIDSLILRKGLVYTEMNSSIILPPGSQGFDRSGVAEGSISHIVGQVTRSVSAGRNEYPVGSATYYRPVALTFNVNPGVMINVRHIDRKPAGTTGLPIVGGIQPGVDIARCAPFCWSVVADSGISPTVVYHLELTGGGFTDFDSRDPRSVGVIRRSGSASDAAQPWVNQGGGVDNYVLGGVLTTTRWNSVGGLSSDTTTVTYGLVSKLVVANAFAIILPSPKPVFKHSLSHPPLFAGNEGPLRFSVNVKDTTIAKAEILQDDTLVVTAKRRGETTLTISGSDTAGNKATYVASVVDSLILDCFPSPSDGRPILTIRKISFGNIEIGKFRDTTFTVTNYGCNSFGITITTSNHDFSVLPSRTQVPFTAAIITVRFAPSSTGNVSAAIVISTDGPTFPPDTIAVSGFGVPITGVVVKREIPLEYSLSQNYPNPFNPQTTIQFTIPKTSYVTLTIYNTLGQEVGRLLSQELNAGTHIARWEADVPSGIYFYRLQARPISGGQAGGFTETRKMILLR